MPPLRPAAHPWRHAGGGKFRYREGWQVGFQLHGGVSGAGSGRGGGGRGYVRDSAPRLPGCRARQMPRKVQLKVSFDFAFKLCSGWILLGDMWLASSVNLREHLMMTATISR